MKLIFFASVFLILYVYAGYPLLVLALGKLRPRPVRQGGGEPTVTILIAAYNEEECIRRTVENKLSLDYPPEKLEILVISDGSTDRTEEEVSRLADPRVRLLRQEPRAGKTAALNLGVGRARGEVLVFSDANSLFQSDALLRLVANFADPEVGYVTGRMVYQDPAESGVGEGCSAYMRYENFLRRAESRIGSVIGVDGGIDAVRRSLYREMRPDQLPDFVLPLMVAGDGRRVIYEPSAVLWEPSLTASGDEYRMRVRVALRALWALFDMRHLLSLRGRPLFAWQLWSHKVLRYLVFVFLAGALASNVLLWQEGAAYRGMMLVQLAGYLGAGLYSLWPRLQTFRLARLPFYFVLVNLAAAHAFAKFVCGRKQVVWTPRKG